ncbi:MAG: AAA family ATPase, partial [Alphaproteobacteria bacterium]|nr:AAA family ATPase [Alphaproteobacteria bacterium]
MDDDADVMELNEPANQQAICDDVSKEFAKLNAEAKSHLAHFDNQNLSDRIKKCDKPRVVVLTSIQGGTEPRDREIFRIYGSLINKKLLLSYPEDPVAAQKLLLADFPHARHAVNAVFNDGLTKRDENARPYFHIKPTLLVGPQGTAKSWLAQRIPDVLGIPSLLYSVAGVADSMFGSLTRKWSTGAVSVPASLVARSEVANPFIILDEIDKAGTRHDNGRIEDVLLGLLEKSTAKIAFDQYLGAVFRLDFVNYIATANDISRLSKPLLDRFRVIRVCSPEAVHVPELISAFVRSYCNERGLDLRWIAPFSPNEIALITQYWKSGSLRELKKYIDAAIESRDH